MSANIDPTEHVEVVSAGCNIEQIDTQTVSDAIISVFPQRPADPTQAQTLSLVESSSTLDFWLDEDDIYTNEDGDPL